MYKKQILIKFNNNINGVVRNKNSKKKNIGNSNKINSGVKNDVAYAITIMILLTSIIHKNDILRNYFFSHGYWHFIPNYKNIKNIAI